MSTAETRILRVGIIQGGKIIEERLVRRREPVTIGQSPKNSFYIPISKLPRSLTLFDVKGDDYILCFGEEMQGRVSIQEKVFTLDDIRSNPNVMRKGGVFFLRLDDKSRGKVVLGDITLLFQFVSPPPVVPKPQLPASARGGLGQAIMGEYQFLLAIIVSFFLQGGFIVMSNFFESPVDKSVAAKRFISQALSVDVEFEEDEEKEEIFDKDKEKEGDEEEEEVTEEVTLEPAPRPKPKPKPEPAKTRVKKQPVKVDAETLRKRRRAKLRNTTILKHITSSAEGGTATDALRAGQAFKEAFDSNSGITVGRAGEVAGFKGGTKLGAEGSSVSLARLSKKERGSGRLKTGKVKGGKKAKETKVKIRVGLRGGRKSGGMGQLDGKTVTSVFRRRANAFRACYERRLKVNPNLKGKVVIRFTIGTAGRITSINVTSNSTGDSAVGSCITGKVRGWRFTPPKKGAVTFTYPIVLSTG